MNNLQLAFLYFFINTEGTLRMPMTYVGVNKKVKKGTFQLVHKPVENEEITEKWNANFNQLLKFFPCPELPWILVACLSLLELPLPENEDEDEDEDEDESW